MRRAVVGGAPIIPAFGGKVGGAGGLLRVQRHVKTEQHTLVHGRHFARQCVGRAGVTHAPQAADLFGLRAPYLEPSHVKLAIARVDGLAQGRKGEVARQTDDRGLLTGTAPVEQHQKNLWPIVAEVNQ